MVYYKAAMSNGTTNGSDAYGTPQTVLGFPKIGANIAQ